MANLLIHDEVEELELRQRAGMNSAWLVIEPKPNCDREEANNQPKSFLVIVLNYLIYETRNDIFQTSY